MMRIQLFIFLILERIFNNMLNKQAINLATKKVLRILVKNAPKIFTVLSVIGVAGTTGLAIYGTTKAIERVKAEEDQREKDSVSSGLKVVPMTKTDIIKIVWPCYIPAVFTAGTTVGFILAADKIHAKRNAALTALYSVSQTALTEYQKKIVATVGENKEKKIREELIQDKLDKNPVEQNEVFITNDGEMLCYDSLSGRYFKSSIEKIRKNVNDYNYSLFGEGTKSLNEFYYDLGLESTILGEQLGWMTDYGMMDVYFTSKLATNGQPCIVVEYRIMPRMI
jgi:hypothetical protein